MNNFADTPRYILYVATAKTGQRNPSIGHDIDVVPFLQNSALSSGQRQKTSYRLLWDSGIDRVKLHSPK
jgi:hypothetical protein